jgi:hypothetical protein
MRIYIIGNDGITLCREAPATVNDGEIVVTSKEELHAAPLSGKRLLALWNALPGVEKRRTVGDRGALIDRLWPAIEDLPDPEPPSEARRPSKQDEVIAMLRRPEGATVDEVARATGWQSSARVSTTRSATVLRPKQSGLVAGKGQFRSRFHHPLSHCCPTTIFRDVLAALFGWLRAVKGQSPHDGCGLITSIRKPADRAIATAS